ncbi:MULTISPECIES: DNA adenine methylase [Chryseobacterium]|uniref:DNA adenine methylase n=1 Tax=Chryseobacterium TaxID=59732 RepID=UPI001627B187|nr:MULTISPECIES: DNA adenine methylase [Chryseobacterium]MBF6643948.1 DNA adenine methylase [Chryseobacterium indologenes]MBU3046814.1 DNA adenine methylase [Chryseobacterium indologenes]QQQ72325.1 DNA adenine methylase [Chryseobacterium indologenes]
MNYLGSKGRLLPFISSTVEANLKHPLSSYSFCDLFAGTGAVGNYFQTKVKSIIYNDRELYSYIINRAYHSPIDRMDYDFWITYLNDLTGTEAFIFNEYSEKGSAGRLYFSANNGRKIDAIRTRLTQLLQTDSINEELFNLLLATLLLAADKVANTASVYCAYLKMLKNSATAELKLIPIKRSQNSGNGIKVYNEDSLQLIQKISGDILYLDPPYNGREYSAYYHLLNTIALYDPTFKPKGKAGLRDYFTSQFCLKSKVENALMTILSQANFRHIFLSYNNEGLIPPSLIEDKMSSFGTYQNFQMPYQRFKSQKTSSKSTTIEFLHHLIKD